MWHRELLRLDDETSLEASVAADRGYRLALWCAGECLIEFRCDKGIHRRSSRERSSVYQFRSIEQLRYDFEQEIEHLVDRR